MISTNRRRMLEGKLSETAYTQSGLVFQLDGINKGVDSTAWTDLIGGIKFAYTTHSDPQWNGVKFDGSGCIRSDRNLLVGYNTGTIEVAYSDKQSGGILMMASTNTALTYMFSAAGIAYFPKNSSNIWKTAHPTVATASVNNTRAMLNGSLLADGKTATTWTQNNTSIITLAGRVISSGNMYYAKLKIHAIRIYNRKLTEQEMLYNQKIDNIRFNLGQNI